MTMIRRPSPFGELLSLRHAMDRLFEDSFVRPGAFPGGGNEGLVLPLDVYHDEDALVIEAALPGVPQEDVEVNVLGDTLTISGSTRQERSSEEAGRYLFQEIRRGTFSRTVTLPSDLQTERATASFENGVLRLSIPKAPETKPRQIRISPTTEGRVGAGAPPANTSTTSPNPTSDAPAQADAARDDSGDRA